jgi:hypothetical protein
LQFLQDKDDFMVFSFLPFKKKSSVKSSLFKILIPCWGNQSFTNNYLDNPALRLRSG